MDIQGYVLDAIDRFTRASGDAALEQIVQHVDYYQRIVPTYDELLTALSTGIINGRIVEVSHLRFQTSTDAREPGTFSGVTSAEYAQALEWHRSRVAKELAKLDGRGDV